MVGALFKHLKLKVYIACMCIHFGGKILGGKFARDFAALNVYILALNLVCYK